MKRLASASRFAFLASLLGLVWLLAISGSAWSAEIELKSQAACRGIIRLGDIAEVFGDSAEVIAKLKNVELGPAPRAGMSQWITRREVQDALWRRNIDYVSHGFSGANRVEVKNNAVVPANFEEATTARSVPMGREAAKQSISQLIGDFLRQRIDAQTDWRVQLEITADQAASLNAHAVWEIAGVPRRPTSGDIHAWLGEQQIAFEPVTAGGGANASNRIQIVANIALPPTFVTLRYDVRSGTVLTENHLQTQIATDGEFRGIEPLELSEVIGKEVIRTLNAGTALDSSMIRNPQLVRKSDTVTVVVINGPVRLRAVGRALANGSLGEEIDVLPEFQKEHFPAKVIGPGTVEVNLSTRTSSSNAKQQAARIRPPQQQFVPAASQQGRMNNSAGQPSGANQPTSLSGRQSNTNGNSLWANRPSQLRWNGR